MNNCWLLHPHSNILNVRSAKSSLNELELLAKSIKLKIIKSSIVKIKNIKYSSYFSDGKI